MIVVTSPGEYGFGMYTLGHALCCVYLVKWHHHPASVRSVAVVRHDDEAMSSLARDAGIEVVVAA